MRFITEFTSDYGYGAPVPFKEYENEKCLGHLIAESFDWQRRGETTLYGPVRERHTLEIEAFPMDKWIEFRVKIIKYLSNCISVNEPPQALIVLEMFEELESFGKPAKKNEK